jgi:Xaa-Pro aminopeptidase
MVSAQRIQARLDRVAGMAVEAGIDAVLVTPGPDLRYLIEYDAVPLERLTCLIIPAQGDPTLVVPELEVLAAKASPGGAAGIDIRAWPERADPYVLVAEAVGSDSTVALDNHMWAEKVLRLRDAGAGARQVLAGPLIERMRMIKSADEVASLVAAGEAIDRVHAAVPGLLRPGRTEAEVGADIADLILQAGHVRVDFVIVASGPNGASPHHEVSDRVLEVGDTIVIDIGGTMPDGYRSDCTRMYSIGTPDSLFLERYEVLQRAQHAGVETARLGSTCGGVDAAARDILTDAGLGDLFIHRTGHGIGLETHEEPYILAGSDRPLEPGMAFSVEPGFYAAGVHGARIEDIVVVTDSDPLVLNHGTRDLVVVE